MPRTAQMQLSIEVGSEPIVGSVMVDNGASQQFSGWIELVAAIESVREAQASPGGEHLGAVSGASGRQV